MVTRMRGIVAGLVLTAVASPAFAQSQNKFAIGAQFSTKPSLDPMVHRGTGIDLLWRIGHTKTGWKWKWGLPWYGTDVDRAIGGTTTEFGRVQLRPILAGYGYSHVIGRTSVSANVLGGYAFSSFSLAPAADDAYHQRLGAQSITTTVKNPLVLKPEVNVWFDVSRKVGVRVNANYLVARPTVTVRSTLGEDRTRIHADKFSISVGTVYSVF